MNTSTTLRRYASVIIIMFSASLALMAQETLSKQKPKPKPEPEAPKPSLAEQRTLSVGLTVLLAPMIGNGVESGFRFPTVPSCCPGYEGTSGTGVMVGAELLMPLSAGLEFGARVVYQSSSANFTANEPITVRVGNNAVSSSIQHGLNTSVGALFVEPTINYEITHGVFVTGGLRLGTILSGTYDQTEKLADPTLPYDFSNGSALWNTSDGSIPNTSGFQFGAVVGIRTAVAFGSSLTIMPEVSYAPMFTSVVSDATWTASPLRVGVGVLMNITKLEAVSTPIAP